MTGIDPVPVTLTVNARTYRVSAEPRRLLSDVLREDCGLTGTHVGCEHGVCGACTILFDGAPARACLLYAVQAQGCAITTIEAFAANGELSVVQQALHEEHGLQCGFCTPGMLISAWDLLRRKAALSEAEIRIAMSGNLCRCTGYQGIVRSIKSASETWAGQQAQGQSR